MKLKNSIVKQYGHINQNDLIKIIVSELEKDGTDHIVASNTRIDFKNILWTHGWNFAKFDKPDKGEFSFLTSNDCVEIKYSWSKNIILDIILILSSFLVGIFLDYLGFAVSVLLLLQLVFKVREVSSSTYDLMRKIEAELNKVQKMTD
jgi:hypothetical protein